MANNDDATKVLKLFVVSTSPQTAKIIQQIQALCDSSSDGPMALDVIDILQSPELADREKIVAVPTLIKELPPPMRRVIGDLSNSDQVREGLALGTPKPDASC